MTTLPRDENRIPTAGAVSEVDGTTVIPLQVTSTRLLVNLAATGANNGGTVAGHDENHETTLIGISATDGVTPVPIYADTNGMLLITE